MKTAAYNRWKGQRTSIWQRRWVIVHYGISLATKSKIFRFVAVLGLTIGLFLIGAFFTLGQLVTPDSSLLSFIAQGNEKIRDTLNGFASWVILYPEICVDGFYRAMFYAAFHGQLFIALIAVATFVPKLCAQDIASNAIVIYNSKALGKGDYILGKLGIPFLLLSGFWLLPVCFAWIVGNVMSPDWSYFFHSSVAALRGITLISICIVVISIWGVAISSLTKRSGISVILWIFYWILTGVVADVISKVYEWGKYLSLNNALNELALSLFRFDQIFAEAKAMIPFFDYYTRDSIGELPDFWVGSSSGLSMAIIAVSIHCILGVLILTKRLLSS
ncbi:hypothetical protein MLD52_08380 [Puniceicoccaceae bacterium K14]|nr:hypothetical protein [Puniceicoccaceae bacterium K14]